MPAPEAGMVAFAGHRLDRADHVRCDAARLAQLRASADARVLVLDGLIPVLSEEGRLTWGSLAYLAEDAETVFLGLLDGAALFAAVPGAGDTRPSYLQRLEWETIGRLPADELALYGGARSLVDWHARHRFCARCGQPTKLAKGGWQRDCHACTGQHFPRTDPVAIMLVEHEGAVLLGRGAQFPTRSYSALAGFIEPGETIEQAVAREVFEEVGLRVEQVRYVASQPWPFPSQLMIGCHALADKSELVIDANEIEDARWFTRRDVADALEGGAEAAFLPPPPAAIAHSLLRWWLERAD